MKLFFISSFIGLVGTLISGIWWGEKKPRLFTLLLFVFSAATLVGLFGVLFIYFMGDTLQFERPYMLLGLIFPVLVIGAQLLLKKQFVRRINYPLAHLKVEQSSLRVLFSKWLTPLLYVLALILMVLALARPVKVDRTVLPPTEGIDIILLMDASASMQNTDFYPNRFIASQLTAKRFIGKRLTDRIGLVVFAKQAMLQAPLTLDHEALQEYLSSMYIGMVDPNYTAIGDAIGVAAAHLKDSKAKSKVIILLTDGDSNAGTIEPILAAEAAQAYNIRIYTIGTASAPDQALFSSQTDEINEGLLQEIAAKTGGQFYRAKNEDELKKIYDRINELETTVFTGSSSVHKKDVYSPLLWLALAALLGALVLEKIIFIKIP